MNPVHSPMKWNWGSVGRELGGGKMLSSFNDDPAACGLRPNKKVPLFRATRPYLSGGKIILFQNA